MNTAIRITLALALLGQVAPLAEGKDVSHQLIQRLGEMTPEQAVSMRYGWEIPGQDVYCVGSLPTRRSEVPILACRWGPGANVTTNRHLFWKDGDNWRSQPYPPNGLQGNAGIVRLYQKGPDLVVIMDVGIAQTRYAEQPQLLRRRNGTWRLVWMPQSQEWSGYLSDVQFEGDSLDRFSVWTDSSVLPKEQLWPFVGPFGQYLERWRRRGDEYVRVSRTEAPQPEMAVVHFVQALARGTEAEARRWVIDPKLVAEAQGQGIAKFSYVGFVQPKAVERKNGDVIVGLSTNTYERRPSWLVTVRWHEGRWLVSNIQAGKVPNT